MRFLEGLILISIIIFLIYHACRLPCTIIEFVAWLYRHNFWFPKTIAEVREENIEDLEYINGKLQLYNDEMEKRELGTFR